MTVSVKPSVEASLTKPVRRSDGFLSPLPGMLAGGIERLLQRAVKLHDGRKNTPPGAALEIQLVSLGFALRFSRSGDELVAVDAIPGKPSPADDMAIITASPATLLLQASTLKPGGRLTIQGDAGIAQQWQHYFAGISPDWEKGITERLGPVMGVQVHKALSVFQAWIKRSGADVVEMTGEYLQEESRVLVTRLELEQFLDDVDELSIRLDRLLSRYR